MKPGDMMELDREIVRLEKELSTMYRKRMSILESEMQSSKARAESLLGGAAPSTARGAAVKSAEPVVARKEKTPAKGRGKGAKKKRTRMRTAEVESRLIGAVRSAGSEGISLKGISESAGVNYQTAAKKLKEMADKFVKKGELKEARFFLKS